MSTTDMPGTALVLGSTPLVTVDSGSAYLVTAWRACIIVETPVSRETKQPAREIIYALAFAYFAQRVEHRLGRYLTWDQDTGEIKSTEPSTYQGGAHDRFELAWRDTQKWMDDALRQWGASF